MEHIVNGKSTTVNAICLLLKRFSMLLPLSISLREKCPNTELYLVRIFPHLDWIQRDTSYLSVFSPNAGKIRIRITPHTDTFYAVIYTQYSHIILNQVLNPFHAIGLFLYPLKASQNQRFLDVFKGYRKRLVV